MWGLHSSLSVFCQPTAARRLKMSPFVTDCLFVVACLTVPIVWGIIVNWVFHRLKAAAPSDEESEAESSDEPVIEYYI
jgi:hypothetical protein